MTKQFGFKFSCLFRALVETLVIIYIMIILFFYIFRVKHLILADPWGFSEKPEDLEQKKSKMPLWARALFLTLPLNPLWAIRTAGPWGKYCS